MQNEHIIYAKQPTRRCGCDEDAGYIPSLGNTSCVKRKEVSNHTNSTDNYTIATDDYWKCPMHAFIKPEATSSTECYCPSGSDLRAPTWSNDTRECAQCGAGAWASANSTCQTCYPDSWSLPGTPDQKFCLCNPGFYADYSYVEESSDDSGWLNPWGNGSNVSACGNETDESDCGNESIGESDWDNETASDSSKPALKNQSGTCARVRGTVVRPCVPCPRFSNTTGSNASSIWDCKCNPSYVQVRCCWFLMRCLTGHNGLTLLCISARV
jgi:hypothetical protein